MFERKLECTETILTKDPIQNINTHGELIFAVTQSHKMKVDINDHHILTKEPKSSLETIFKMLH